MKFACPSCAVVYEAEESRAGRVVACPGCHADFRLPDAEPVLPKRLVPESGEESKRITAGILAIFLGGMGIHKFYLGYTRAGLIHLLLFFCSCGATKLIGWIEAIVYLTKSDADFVQTYQRGQKEWF
jgi:TM2 domain-containing membrane protein YozV